MSVPFCDKSCRYQAFGRCMRDSASQQSTSEDSLTPCGFGTSTDPYGDIPDEAEALYGTNNSVDAYY